MKEKDAGEAPCNEGTSSKPPQSKVEENIEIKILQRKNKSEIQNKIEGVDVRRSYIEVIKEKQLQQRIDPPPRKNVFKRSTTSRQVISSRYPSMFNGYFF